MKFSLGQKIVMLITVAVLVVIVQVFQEVGIHVVNRLDKRIN